MPAKRREAGGSDIGRAILAYLVEHPHAQDTSEGVRQWWLGQRGIACNPDALRPALDELVRSGLLVVIHASDARVHYRLNTARKDEIAAMLAR